MKEAISILLLMRSEMMIVLTIVILLIMKVADTGKSSNFWLGAINAFLLINCLLGWLPINEGIAFGGMFKSFALASFGKNILSTGVLLISLTSTEWLRKCRHLIEFYLLLLSSLLGMFFMLSSGNLLMFYLSLELASIPLAALCNFNFEERRSSEAAMKMILSSAFASSIMLMGISFIYGEGGTLDFEALTLIMHESVLFVIGFVFLFVGIVFKLSVVPFHLWTADVYEGSPVPVTAFLSVISKSAMVIVFSSLLYHVFGALHTTWYGLLYMLSILTILTGNIFAIRQNNLKRLLAFSSITQMGYILIGILGTSAEGIGASLYFIVIYMFSNIAAFGVIAIVSAKTGNERISSFVGLSKSNPFLAWTMAIALFSLAGIPPTAGFFGKIFLLKAGAAKADIFLIVFAAINMIIALSYYLKVIRAIFMDTNAESFESIRSGYSYRIAIVICLIGIVGIGFVGNIYEFIYSLTKSI